MTTKDLEEGVDRLIVRGTGTLLRGKASALGARLSNEILSIRGLTEKEMKARISSVGAELAASEKMTPVPGHLLGDFNQALELYPDLVERYERLGHPADLGERLIALGNEVAFLDRVTEHDLGGPRGTLLRNWVAGVFLADEALKRQAARTIGEKASVTPASAELGRVSWNTATALAGALAIGGLIAMESK